MNFVKLVFITACLFFFNSLNGQNIGPEKGSLMIVGGNAGLSPSIFKKFIDMAGGPTANIIIIPTANGGRNFGPYFQGRVFQNFHQHGAFNLTILHTDDRLEADTENFVEPIHKATGVWFTGGRQWRIADAYLNTKTHEALEALLDRGGIVGGSSAGATILGSYLVRGDSKTNTIMMGDHVEGFGFLKNSAVDQHLLRRNRQFDMVEVMQAHPELLGFGLDEGTGILVYDDLIEVVGRYYVAIYDPKIMTDKAPFYLLKPTDRFDLKNRKPLRYDDGYEKMSVPGMK